MALYSWFGKDKNKPNKKRMRPNNNLLKAPASVRYIENYIMWPTAKIKQGAQFNLPVYDAVEVKLTKEPKEPNSALDNKPLSLDAALIVNK